MSARNQRTFSRSVVGRNVWLSRSESTEQIDLSTLTPRELNYEVLESETSIGWAQLEEIRQAAKEKEGDLVILLLGGRGAQALHGILGQMAETDEADDLLNRLHVFTQDALAPMRMDNGLSFVRDFERLLGESFFKKVKS